MFCATCGTATSDNARFCGGCGVSLVAAAVDLPVGMPQIAPLSRRVVAAILDFLAIWSVIAAIVVALPSGLLKEGFEGKWPESLIPTGLCLIGIGYYVLLETLLGATPGKGITGIQVRLIDDATCDLRAALIRNLLRIVDAFFAYMVGFVVAMLSKSRQRIGDLAAGTIVVLRPSTTTVRTFLVLVWVFLTSVGFFACNVVPRH
jgi:uncharacterized RDD family membrane protein YckC